MTTSSLDIITGAAKLLGVVFKSESLSSDEANDGLVLLNDLLDTWSNGDVSTISYTIESFPCTGAASYTIGTGGNFNTARPLNIVTAVVRLGSIDYPLNIIPTDQFQEDIALKSTPGPIPKFLTYDGGYPLGIIKMYPVPSSGTTLYLQTNKPLSNLSALTTTVDLPPGWKRALKYNLAIDMAPQYGVDPSAVVVAVAKESFGAIKRATSIVNAMPLLSEPVRDGNIYSGWWT